MKHLFLALLLFSGTVFAESPKGPSTFETSGGALLGANLAYQASGKEAPQALHYANGVYGVWGAGKATVASITQAKICAGSDGLVWKACVMAVFEGLGAVTSAATAYMSFANSDEYRIPRGDGNPDGVPADWTPTGFPDGDDGGGAPPPNFTPPVPTDVLKDKAKDIENKANLILSDLRSKGVPVDEISKNPEKYLTPEDLAKVKAEMAQNQAGAKPSTEDMLKDIMEGDTNSNVDTPTDTNFRTAAFDGGIMVDDFSFDDFGFDKLFSELFHLGVANSAPGYYGNVPLKFLAPKSKKSLFERVSLKIQKLM